MQLILLFYYMASFKVLVTIKFVMRIVDFLSKTDTIFIQILLLQRICQQFGKKKVTWKYDVSYFSDGWNILSTTSLFLYLNLFKSVAITFLFSLVFLECKEEILSENCKANTKVVNKTNLKKIFLINSIINGVTLNSSKCGSENCNLDRKLYLLEHFHWMKN